MRPTAAESLIHKDLCQNHHLNFYKHNHLPHFDHSNTYQFITYRLADSLPLHKRLQIEAEIKTKSLINKNFNVDKRNEYKRKLIENYLDAGFGDCILQNPVVAQCITETWQKFNHERYVLIAWVVMPNHVHLLIKQNEGYPLGKIILSWKSYTAKKIAKIRRGGPRRSQEDLPIWQRDYWDRWIRNEKHFEKVIEYIHNNPVKAGLAQLPHEWPWSSANTDIKYNHTVRV